MSPSFRPRLALCAALASACEFGPLEPGEPFTAGVYHVAVTVDDGCGQIDLAPTPPLDCRGGLWTDPDEGDGLVAFWPELDGETYVIHDGLLPEVVSAPVLRWSTSARELPKACTTAEQRWVLSLSNDGSGLLNGSLRNTWSNVANCPIGSGIPQSDCTTQFTYRYELETACAPPCELVDATDVPAEGEPYDCGLSICECP